MNLSRKVAAFLARLFLRSRDERKTVSEPHHHTKCESSLSPSTIPATKLQPCQCCFNQITEREARVLPCHHVYCVACVATCCVLALKDRSKVPARCCSVEFPVEYVHEVLSTSEFKKYERFVRDRKWSTSNLASDSMYTSLVQQLGGMQCPQCGIGVIKISGCNTMQCPNRHTFVYVGR